MIKWLLWILPVVSFGQSYAPEPGVQGSTALNKDSSVFVEWANAVSVTRGPLNITDPGLGNASYGTETDAIGQADGAAVVSLGDGGEAVLSFEFPITNGPGYDFAVFENGFIDHYLELGFVEVSSDGINFVRFDAITEIQTDIQLTNFDTVNCRYVHNFAGKYRAGYGTPFDLEELNGIAGLDINAVTHVRIIDVVGSIDPAYGNYDSQGTIINDPFPTAFESCGFDLDGVGVIHGLELGTDEKETHFSVFPNPVKDVLQVTYEGEAEFVLYDLSGNRLEHFSNVSTLDISQFPAGVYYLECLSNTSISVHRVVKQ